MFGYVTPCKMEMKVKEWHLYRSYYCGLCKSIKKNFGEIPRLTLNNDLTFLAILLDSLDDVPATIVEAKCLAHPLSKHTIVKDNTSIDYCALCNLILAYYKMHDDYTDDSSIKAGIFSKVLSIYLKKIPSDYIGLRDIIINKLTRLTAFETSDLTRGCSIDEVANSFSELTGEILSFNADKSVKTSLYELGYNLGKWIYIIDAFDDLESDMKKKEFNAIENSFNVDNLCYEEFYLSIKDKVDFLLFACGNRALEILQTLPIKKNKVLLDNVLRLGLQEQTFKVFNKKNNNKDNIAEILSQI